MWYKLETTIKISDQDVSDDSIRERLKNFLLGEDLDFDEFVKDVGYISITPMEPMKATSKKKGPTSADVFLIEVLRGSTEVPVNNVYAKGKRAGLTQRQLNRAKLKLGVISKRRGQGWVWSLPNGPRKFVPTPDGVRKK